MENNPSVFWGFRTHSNWVNVDAESFGEWRPTGNRFPHRRRPPVVDTAWRKRKKNKAKIARPDTVRPTRTPLTKTPPEKRTLNDATITARWPAPCCGSVSLQILRQTHYMWMALNLRIATSQRRQGPRSSVNTYESGCGT